MIRTTSFLTLIFWLALVFAPPTLVAQIPDGIGHWQIEQNVYNPTYSIVVFYNNKSEQVYEEHLELYLELVPYNVKILDELFVDFMDRYARTTGDATISPVIRLDEINWQQQFVRSKI